MSLLEVRNLHTELVTPRGTVKAVNGIDFQVSPGEVLALVGESGSGKSMTALSIMGLLPKNTAQITSGEIRFNQTEITSLEEKDYNLIRGKEISMIFQNPLTALDPSYKIGTQLVETIAYRRGINKKEAVIEARQWLQRVGISDVERVLKSYPHALSGGMRQRMMIAMAISCRPKLIIADEPTTALDATIQKQILNLLKSINQELSVLLNVFIGSALGAIEEASKYTTTTSRAWITSGVEKASEDPSILRQYGEFWVEVQGAVSLADRAWVQLDRAWEKEFDLTEEERGETAVLVAAANVLAGKVALDVTSRIFDVMGARSATTKYGFDRFWRNVRTHTLHNPAEYKLRNVGRWVLTKEYPTPGYYS